MDNVARDIAVGAAGNLTFAIVLVAFAFVASKWIHHGQLRDFLGVTEFGRGAIRVRLSNMQVKPFGTQGTQTVAHGYTGPALMGLEYRYSLQLAKAIETGTIIRVLRGLVGGFTNVEEPVLCDIGPSRRYDGAPPVDFTNEIDLANELQKELKESTHILVGSPVYNLLTTYILSRPESRLKFYLGQDEPRRGFCVERPASSHPAKPFTRAATPVGGGKTLYTEYAAIYKKRVNGGSLILCAGTSPAANVAALDALADWRKLAKRFNRQAEFLLVYEVSTWNRNEEPFDKQEVWCDLE